MRYEVMSRLEARQATREPDAPDTAIISIIDYGSDTNTFYEQAWLKDVITLQFDDTEAAGPQSITREQAAEIAGFVLRMHKHVERIIVHCEFGQSRSAGTAAAISEYLEGHDSGICRNRKYYPNPLCYRYVLDALRKRGKIPRWLLRICCGSKEM